MTKDDKPIAPAPEHETIEGLAQIAKEISVSTATMRSIVVGELVAFDRPPPVSHHPVTGRWTADRGALRSWWLELRKEYANALLPAAPIEGAAAPKPEEKRGRPAKAKGTARSGNTTVRLSEQDATRIKEAADVVDEGVSVFLRTAGLERADRVLAKKPIKKGKR